jgi:hypothetical protein
MKVGDTIFYTVTDPETGEETRTEGKIKEVRGDTLVITGPDGVDLERPANDFETTRRIVGKPYEYWPDTKELLENSAVAVAYNSFWRKKPLMGSDNVGFVLSNAAHEYLLKYYGTAIGEFFLPKTLVKDQTAYFQMADITDALRKAPFLAAYQGLINKFIYRKSFSGNLMHDLIADTVILSSANLADRMFYGDEKAPYKYQ